MSNNIDLYIQELEDSKVEIKRAIIAKGVTPTGGLSSYADAVKMIPTGGNSKMLPLSKTITENGEYEYNPVNDGVDGYSRVSMNVDIPIPTFETQSKEVTIKKNGTTSIVPDSGYDGLSKVDVTVKVATGGSDKPQIFNGFRFTGGDIAQVDFSQYDWSLVYDTSEFFRGCSHSTGDWSNFEENFNGEVLSGYYMFQGFLGTSIPNIGYPICLAECMFSGCSNLTTIPQMDTSNVTNMSYMFQNCGALTSIPQLDTSNVTNMGSMFGGCSNLTTIPQMDTSNVTNMSHMFSQCLDLITIPQLNTSNVTSMNYMFYNCSALTTIPQLDTSNVTNMGFMFQNCPKLIELPDFNSVKVTGFGAASNAWLSNSYAVQKIGVVDCDSVTDIGYFFGYRQHLNFLTDFGGCRNLGKASSVANMNGDHFMICVPNLTYESVMNVINGLYDRAAAGLSVLTLKLHANHLAMLSEDDIAIATNKGWTIV